MADSDRRLTKDSHLSRGSQFAIQTRPEHGRWLVAVQGPISLSTVGTLEAELHHLSDRAIVLDLSQVDFIDSTGVALLFRTAGRLTIGAVSSAVERVLHGSGVVRQLRFTS